MRLVSFLSLCIDSPIIGVYIFIIILIKETMQRLNNIVLEVMLAYNMRIAHKVNK